MAMSDSLQSFVEAAKDFDINDVDWENPGGWPVAVKAIVLIVVFVGCVFGGFKFDIEDMQRKQKVVVSEEEKLREEFRTKAFNIKKPYANNARQVFVLFES